MIKNDLKLSTDLDYLKQKIRDKYSAEYINNTNNRLILIKKSYYSKTKYLLFDTEIKEVFRFFWEVKKIKKTKEWYYMSLNDYKWNQTFILYNRRNILKLEKDF